MDRSWTTATAELKPSDETLKQGWNLDHGKLDSPSPSRFNKVFAIQEDNNLLNHDKIMNDLRRIGHASASKIIR